MWFFSSVLLRFLPGLFLQAPILLVAIRALSIGSATGWAQTRVLPRTASGAGPWIAATALGCAAASTAGAALTPLIERLGPRIGRPAEAVVLLVVGAVMGAVQAGAFRNPTSRRRLEWAAAVGAGWLLGALLPGLLGMAQFAYTPGAIGQALWGTGLALTTLAPLARLTRSN
jgi:hypothetical protein